MRSQLLCLKLTAQRTAGGLASCSRISALFNPAQSNPNGNARSRVQRRSPIELREWEEAMGGSSEGKKEKEWRKPVRGFL
ncbi:hypothetical protein TNCV_1076251 [Trichonephila clavipes]|uniref:Uncharacterized protein n=1 Tax=Trichonephila clavipes TaxID=2585209 RepID=A0A8X6RR09_TRICX|nr:hypothetical protein TNCV_1076251 [Trichonephila clavipes]